MRGHRYAGWMPDSERRRHLGGSPKAPSPPPNPPSKSDAQIQAELAAQRAGARNRRGFTSDILTSSLLTGDRGLGSTGSGKATLGG